MQARRFILYIIFSITITLGLSISFGSLLAAWTGPISDPPGDNSPSPINISATGQAKQGGLILNTSGGLSSNGLIVHAGNVGIGTSFPSAKLSVQGTAGQSVLNIANSIGTSLFYVTESGNVGAGITNPSALLHLSSATNPTLKINGSSNTVAQLSAFDGTNLSRVGTVSGHKFYVMVGGVNVIRLEEASPVVNTMTLNGGKVGIGIVTPQASLDVNGDLKVNTGGAFGGYSPSTTFRVTTPTFYAEQAQIGNATGGLMGAGTINAVSLCIGGDCRSSWPSSTGGGITGVTATAPVVSSGGTAPVISMAAATAAANGYMTSAYASKLDGIAAGATVGITQAAADTRYVNVGGDTMSGDLTISSQQLNHNSNNPFYFNSYDALQLRINSDGVGTGDFGINNISNTRVFTVKDNGDTIIGGTGKLTVGTIDPIFDINGEKYSTFAPDYAGGTRIETSGTIHLNYEKEFTIDFDKLEKGSDLWLFWQASNKDPEDVSVLLTSSFQGATWYKKEGNILIIYGGESGEISYRLSAPRVDHTKWGNWTDDQTLEGINISDY